MNRIVFTAFGLLFTGGAAVAAVAAVAAAAAAEPTGGAGLLLDFGVGATTTECGVDGAVGELVASAAALIKRRLFIIALRLDGMD